MGSQNQWVSGRKKHRNQDKTPRLRFGPAGNGLATVNGWNKEVGGGCKEGTKRVRGEGKKTEHTRRTWQKQRHIRAFLTGEVNRQKEGEDVLQLITAAFRKDYRDSRTKKMGSSS